ncbi:MAG TPA: hypothetical protein VM260_21245, partial [Pirellula sp.]|nr:hypothetical protein [Pirellula sp.]
MAHLLGRIHAGGAALKPGLSVMTLVKCFECGSEQDFEVAVGYCEQCGRKLPVPHLRGKTTARRAFLADKRTSEVGTSNVA